MFIARNDRDDFCDYSKLSAMEQKSVVGQGNVPETIEDSNVNSTSESGMGSHLGVGQTTDDKVVESQLNSIVDKLIKTLENITVTDKLKLPLLQEQVTWSLWRS